MNHNFSLKRRESGELPIERLFGIMSRMWGEDTALEKLEEFGYSNFVESYKQIRDGGGTEE